MKRTVTASAPLVVIDTASPNHSIVRGPTGLWVTYCPPCRTIADAASICVWLIPGTEH
jgi:hypothetical protein